uniref:Uncharacterized protein n=1 Tax=Chaetoceros debilis TaxID=122233 RepID=A0A6S8YPJ9_9STRA
MKTTPADKNAQTKVCSNWLWEMCISSPCFEAWRGFTIPLENEKGETKSDEIVEIDAMSMMDREGTAETSLPSKITTDEEENGDGNVEDVSDEASKSSSFFLAGLSISDTGVEEDDDDDDDAISNASTSEYRSFPAFRQISSWV